MHSVPSLPERILSTFLIALPIFAVLLLFLIIELRSAERPNTKEGGLMPVCLLAFPLTAGGTVAYYLVAFLLDGVFSGVEKKLLSAVVILAVLAVLTYIVLLLERLLAKLFALKKKNRIIAMLWTMLLFAGEVIVLAILISAP